MNSGVQATLRTESFKSVSPLSLTRYSPLHESYFSSSPRDYDGSEPKPIKVDLVDTEGRVLNLYATVKILHGATLHLSLWAPFWVVNRSGIPLVIKQHASGSESAGQFIEHEGGKDWNPLMFSFSNDDCPHECNIRVGKIFAREHTPRQSIKFPLTPGVQALKLLLIHDHLPTKWVI